MPSPLRIPWIHRGWTPASMVKHPKDKEQKQILSKLLKAYIKKLSTNSMIKNKLTFPYPPPYTRNKAKTPSLTISVQHYTGSPSQSNHKEKIIKGIQIKAINISLLTEDIIYI